MAAILRLDKVTKTYRKGENEVHALVEVDLSIEPGEFLAIVGPSGSGKTTLLNIVGCLDSPTSGGVLYNGTPLGGLKEDQLSEYRKKHISFIFQSYNLIPVLTVSKAEMRERADTVIAEVGLAGLGERYPRELSGGQEQRVAIARALVKDPYIVLADEPTANLDSRMAEEIVDIMREINKTRNATFIFSTHDALVQKHAKRIVTIRDGIVHSDERK